MASYEDTDNNVISGSRGHLGTLVVSVEGNIGSGKSTFLNYCSSKPAIDVYPEPIEKWRNVNGENLLAKYYTDPANYCFFEHMKRIGVLEPTACHVLNGWYDRAQADHRSRPHAIVYLQTSPLVAYQRVMLRAREEEGPVRLEYITQLHMLHKEWLNREHALNMSQVQERPIHVIDADVPMEMVYGQYENCLQFLDLLNE